MDIRLTNPNTVVSAVVQPVVFWSLTVGTTTVAIRITDNTREITPPKIPFICFLHLLTVFCYEEFPLYILCYIKDLVFFLFLQEKSLGVVLTCTPMYVQTYTIYIYTYSKKKKKIKKRNIYIEASP